MFNSVQDNLRTLGSLFLPKKGNNGIKFVCIYFFSDNIQSLPGVMGGVVLAVP